MAKAQLKAFLPALLLGVSSNLWAQERNPASPPSGPAAAVGDLLDERSVLTPEGTLVVEPSITYSHATTTQVAIEGYTVIPSVLIGLINLSQIQRDTLMGTFAFRYGLSRRVEVELRIPYVYRRESVREREVFEGSPTDIVRDSDGHGLGDVEAAIRVQLNGAGTGPYWVANLRAKSRTGEDPFEVDREQLIVEDGGSQIVVGEVYTEQPTGSGFWSLQPSLSFVHPSDPAVLFGSLSYLWNIERDIGGDYGTIDPGDAVGFNFGLGFAVNERTSYSLGYDHNMIFETKREGDPGIDPLFDRYQVGTLLLGIGHRLTPSTVMNFSLGVGVTEYAPDLQLSLRIPVSF